jgi:hypothetical protein
MKWMCNGKARRYTSGAEKGEEGINAECRVLNAEC